MNGKLLWFWEHLLISPSIKFYTGYLVESADYGLEEADQNGVAGPCVIKSRQRSGKVRPRQMAPVCGKKLDT